jgi:hypothetical protein
VLNNNGKLVIFENFCFYNTVLWRHNTNKSNILISMHAISFPQCRHHVGRCYSTNLVFSLWKVQALYLVRIFSSLVQHWNWNAAIICLNCPLITFRWDNGNRIDKPCRINIWVSKFYLSYYGRWAIELGLLHFYK